MKIATVIYCLFLCSYAMGQRDKEFKRLVLGQYNYDYNTANCNYYYEQAKSLLEVNNPDSLYKASTIMFGLNIFDIHKYPLAGFKPLLKKIVRSNTRYYENMLKGSWRFNFDMLDGLGSAPYDSTRKDTLRVVKLDGKFAYFFFKDSLYKKTTYSIESYHGGFEFQRVNTFNINFHDGKEKWWLMDFEPTRMTIKHEYPCACGCMMYFYKKIQDDIPPVN